MATRIAPLLFLLPLFGVGGCASEEVLVPHSAAVPSGVDLSGTWRLRERDSADERSIIRALGKSTGRKGNVATVSRRRGKGEQVHVFLETGKTLKITQTDYGLFVSVDRSVVEEFRFGENREVNVGEIRARRVSGWDGPVYVVETLDDSRMKLIERFWLSNDRSVLNREITFRNPKLERTTVLRVFDRI